MSSRADTLFFSPTAFNRPLAFPQAFAYAGSTFLNYLGNFFIGPLALIAIVVGLVASFVRPELVSKAVWVAVVCIAVFFVIRSDHFSPRQAYRRMSRPNWGRSCSSRKRGRPDERPPSNSKA
jgi:hypothetical protein